MAHPDLTLGDLISGFGRHDAIQLSDDRLRAAASLILEAQRKDRQENQILEYSPVSDVARDVHRSKARFVCIGGGNGACLPLDAPVLMADGSWKTLGEIRVGDRVIAADPETGNAEPANVARLYRSGRKAVWRVECSDGTWFEATDEHEIPIYRGSGHKTSKGHKLRPHKARLGTWRDSVSTRTPAKRIAVVTTRSVEFSSFEPLMDPYLLGAIIGDGCVSGKSLKFCNKDTDVVQRVAAGASELGTELTSYTALEWGFKGGLLRDALDYYGIRGHNAHTKFVPREVFGWPKAAREYFLAGLIDTDGGQNSYSSVSEVLADGFCDLIRSLGGKATKAARVTTCNGKKFPSFGVYWRLNYALPISLKHKQTFRVKDPIDYARRVCRKVVPAGFRECGDIEVDHPAHCYVTRGNVIVSNSKTETALAHVVMLATGLISEKLDPETRQALLDQFRGPINVRVTLESLTTTLHPVILPKLQWWKWSGYDQPGGLRGHWGWIPRRALVGGSWAKAWQDKLRVLRLLCFDPENPEKVIGESMFQFMSHDQDPSDFASGDFHWALHDEPPMYPIWRENEARTMRTGGRMMLMMTWPDDPAIPVDWIYDTLYAPGRPGPNKDPSVDWFEMWTIHNPHLSADHIKAQEKKWEAEGPAIAQSRLYGRPIRFSNRVHPGFTDHDMWWCLSCKSESQLEDRCLKCGAVRPYLTRFNHVKDFKQTASWPTVYVLDPHPRKPHMMLWVQVDSWDDLWVVAEAMVPGGPDEVKLEAHRIEEELGLNVVARIGDPKMLGSPSGSRREMTWRDEFDAAGLRVDAADSSDVGRQRLNDYLRVDPARGQPKIHVHPRCKHTIWQILRYVWDDFIRPERHDQKQKAKDKDDDFPTMLKYVMNFAPSFQSLLRGAQVIRTRGQ